MTFYQYTTSLSGSQLFQVFIYKDLLLNILLFLVWIKTLIQPKMLY